MTKYISSAMGLIAVILPAISGDVAHWIGTFVTHNPILSSGIIAASWVLFHLLPPPIQAQVTGASMPEVK